MTRRTTLTAPLPQQRMDDRPDAAPARPAAGRSSAATLAASLASALLAGLVGGAGAGAAVLAAAGVCYAALAAFVAHHFTRSRRRLPRLPPAAAAGVQGVAFMASDRRARIAAWYLDAPAARGAVVFVHGKDSCRGDELKSPTLALAGACNAAGLAVLMIDLRGHGASSAARLTFGASERHDVLGAVDWLRARGHARIGVLGASMGAATALLAAADDPRIAAVVADSAFCDLGAMIERQYARLTRMPRCLLPGALLLARLVTGVRLQAVRPLRAAAALRGRPLLVVHAAGDRFIPAADACELAAAAAAELWIAESPRHLGSYAAAPQTYTDRIVGFFALHLGHAPAADSARLAPAC